MEKIPNVVKKVFRRKTFKDLKIREFFSVSIVGLEEKAYLVLAEDENRDLYYSIFIDSKGVVIDIRKLSWSEFNRFDPDREYIVVWHKEDIIELVERLIDEGYEFDSREFGEEMDEYIVTYGAEYLRIYYYDPIENEYERVYGHRDVIRILKRIT
jgi:hypothetical protein